MMILKENTSGTPISVL